MVQTDTNMREVPAGSAGCHSPLLYSQRLYLLNGGSFFISALYAGRSGAVFFLSVWRLINALKKSHLAWYSLFFLSHGILKKLFSFVFWLSGLLHVGKIHKIGTLDVFLLETCVCTCVRVRCWAFYWSERGDSGSSLGHKHCITSLVSMLLCLIFWLELLKVGWSNHVVNRES